MLESIESFEKFSGLARRKFKSYETISVSADEKEKYEAQGWVFSKKLKSSVQLKKEKDHGALLEDRIWSVFYRMKFTYISGASGTKIALNSRGEDAQEEEINLVAIDKEIAIAINCISSAHYKKSKELQKELEALSGIRERFVKSIKQQYSEDGIKKQIALIMFTSKLMITDEDREIARKLNIVLLEDNDLSYYEGLVNHLGPAAKYQILAEILPGKEISGLSIRIPAIKAKMGGYNCYTFSISPEYLLKIAYVSHRAKGKASDINTYQRMLAKGRLKKIKEYITEDGVFPTNIVLNFERSKLLFQKIRQESSVDDDLEMGILGWLDIKPAYKSAWIIDGQHRLFAYSGHKRALKSKLSVLAFEGLKPSKQAELFIDINAKQKSVKQSLLQELYAELHWDADDPNVRIRAIISKAIQDLNNDPGFCLYKRIQITDVPKDAIRCITLTSLFSQIEKKGFHITKEKNNSIVEYGPLWGGDENLDTLKRTMFILKNWLNTVSELNEEWWNKGSAEGGGLAMNDGVGTCINVLRSVFDYLQEQGNKLVQRSNNELLNLIKPFAIALGNHLAGLNEVQRKAFRDLRGVQGVATRTRQCQIGIRGQINDFNPEGLDAWVLDQKQETNKNAKEMIEKIEISLQKFVLDELKREFGESEDDWWYKGIPKTIRQKVTQRLEDEDNKRGGREYYFDLIDYKKIITESWTLFEEIFGFGKGNKDKKTEWIGFVNELRKIVAHASSGKTVSIENFSQLEEYHNWLEGQLTGNVEAQIDDI